jgi:Lhr-like helicase
MEQIEEEVLDQATAARTAEELRAEIASLVLLERTANDVRRSGDDRKWVELSGLLHEVFAQSAMTEKLVIFTEHRDTLSYLQDRISRVLGSANGVQVIHGSIGREDRMKAQEAFKHDPSVRVLIRSVRDTRGRVRAANRISR